MILEAGSKVLVVHRRLFEADKSRYFLGVIEQCEGTLARVNGHTWLHDMFTGRFSMKPDARVKIISLASPGLFVYALPPGVSMPRLKFEVKEGGKLLLHDPAGSFVMDLCESAHGA